MSEVTIRRAGLADVQALADLGRRTFIETFVEGFAVGYPPDDLALFLDQAYAPDAIRRTVSDPLCATWIAERGGDVIAYAIAGPNGLPHPEGRPDDGELYRLYVAREAQGTGLGRTLLDTALAWLERDGPRRLWIGVWSGNIKAQRLYARYGFEKVGEYEFPVGSVRDREFILKRDPLLLSRGAGEVAAKPTEGEVSAEHLRVQRSRGLRRTLSPPEARLWRRVKSPPPGNPRFRRQHPLGPYYLDFYCVEAKLAVEVDGWGHNMGDQPERDERRDNWLRQRGVEVFRVPAGDVMGDPDGVADSIIRTALARIGRG